MPTLVESLLVSARHRLQNLDALLDGLQGRLAASEEGTRRALGIFGIYCKAVGDQIEQDCVDLADDDVTRAELLKFYLRDIGARLDELEEWFARGTDSAVNPSIVDAAEVECHSLMGITRHVILAVGEPDNMATLVDELTDLVFQSAGAFVDETDIPADKFALIQISRFEANNPIWRPMILGHELAHLALLEYPLVENYLITNHLDDDALGALSTYPSDYENLQGFPKLAIETAAEDWLEELLCDAYALKRWGPAAIASLAAYLQQVGAGDSSYGTHPPGWFRIRLMAKWIGELDGVLHEIIEPYLEYAQADHDVEDDWASYLIDVFEGLADTLPPLLADWPDAYDFANRAGTISHLAESLCDSIPAIEVPELPDQVVASDQDIVNAAWLARTRTHPEALYRLVEKALESSDFVRRWQAAGGNVDPQHQEDGGPQDEGEAPDAGSGLLTEQELHRRCVSADEAEQIVVSPMLPGAIKETSIDVRLGRYFIVFQRASTGAFDALSNDDPRSMQRSVERRWGEAFVLHPGELVLAATLEYLVLPPDVGAQVITRSSYGRLGLITATAIQVHPRFRGCLTLELVNLGALPISLYAGERIAQLAMSTASPPLIQPPETKYHAPTKPEFSRVREDRDAPVLRKFRPMG